MTKRMFLIVISLAFMFLNCGNSETPQEGCTVKSSFGTRSVKKDISDTCIQEIAKADHAVCSWEYKNEEETAKHIEYLQTLEISFGKECKEKGKIVECPDFIPETLKLKTLSGCEVYSIEPDTDCLAPCADLYFSTDNDIFSGVYVGGKSSMGSNPFIKSSDSVKEASFSSEISVGSNEALFTWFEKGADGKEIEKTASVEMIVVDPNS